MTKCKKKKEKHFNIDDKGNQNTIPAIYNMVAPSSTSKESLPSEMSKMKKFEKSLGFKFSDFSSPSRFVNLLNRPTDPALLGMIRLLFGFIMLLDIPQERGLSSIDEKYNDAQMCNFPLFDFLKPLPLEWMYVLYFSMWLSALFLMIGFCFRLSSILFAAIYWYLFFLDKTKWNNHSYLYGLHAIMFMVSDANHYWSVDGFLNPKIRNTHVPLWNYTVLRFQNFLVYFFAGIKKMTPEWLGGYSMKSLSEHWVFMPFTLFLTPDQIDLFIVHYFGFFLDLTIGFFLFFDTTRPYAFVFGLSFHLMNSQIFNIGMFPWAMMVTMTIFFYPDWPRKIFKNLPESISFQIPEDEPIQKSNHCIYAVKQEISGEGNPLSAGDGEKSTYDSKSNQKQHNHPQYSLRHIFSTAFAIFYILLQLFLPFSHFITKGYNNWTSGLYGYSWDMMVHRWNTQHLQIMYVERDTGESGFIDPMAFARSSKRWPLHSDMVKQYALCIENRLENLGLKNVELYFDVWVSLTQRFQQRLFDPNTDIIKADWHPFKDTPWILPLQNQLANWRNTMDKITREVHENNSLEDVTFILDFPGYHLENFIPEDLLRNRLTVLEGSVIVEIPEQEKNYTLHKGDGVKVPSGEFHIVHTVSSGPAGYMYTYLSQKKWSESTATCPRLKWYQKLPQDPQFHNPNLLETFVNFLKLKYFMFSRSLTLSLGAVKSIISGQPFERILNETYEYENTHVERSVKNHARLFL
ncbi:vitamin K-dependent gamma-carboxylase isoform X3 [Octopus sinensis]|uniref:Vitamin K-dependent gamma-carboxylase n=1 Tax=Octopus sinensis TaxID=2607531 RepID=A0A7E6EZH5_9MOLL|nr:vitamin K-dependent gamma-carboxylase isoform X3 [Octopus sinensis]